jgi:DNA-binding NtrC family response regulator
MLNNKILIIDDDVDLLASTKIFLQTNNYEVETAINTITGLEVINSFHPDLIILDLMMDYNLEGFYFLNKLKSNDSFKKIPVIINTGMPGVLGVNFRSAIEEVEHLPNTRYLDKSEDWDEMLKTIKELLV